MSTFDNYVCDGQMTIFDSLEILPEEDMVSKVEKETGLKFNYRDDFWGWEYKKRDFKIRIEYGRYSFGDFDRFIGCSIDEKDGGSSCPCDSIEEVVKRIKGYLERREKNEQKLWEMAEKDA